MSGSLNKVMLIGNLGNDPEIRSLNDGARVANFRLATSESWKDRASGERKEKTEWHNVSVFNDGLVDTIEKYLKKGSKVYIEGQLQTRKYEKDGQERFATEVVLRGYNGELKMLDGRADGEGGQRSGGGNDRSSGGSSSQGQRSAPPARQFDDDDVPF